MVRSSRVAGMDSFSLSSLKDDRAGRQGLSSQPSFIGHTHSKRRLPRQWKRDSEIQPKGGLESFSEMDRFPIPLFLIGQFKKIGGSIMKAETCLGKSK